MKKISKTGLLAGILMMSWITASYSQELVESVAAVVGNEVVYLSDVENQISDMKRSGSTKAIEDMRCEKFQDLLISKLFLDQARIDSINVTDDAVENELNMKMNDAIRQAGSEKALESYFKKSMIEIKRDIRKALVQQQVISEVQNNLAKNLAITPNDVKKYYNSIPRDSVPAIPEKVQISLIQVDPPNIEENKAAARQRLLDIRSQILAGKSFNVLAVMYSEDPGSAANGGEIGYKLRGELEKEYADAAFSLMPNTVSKIVETKYGFHIIQLIDKKGDLANTRHILIRPKVTGEETELALHKLDSLVTVIRKGTMKFEEAAMRYSSHNDSRINGGKFVSADPSERITWFTLNELPKEMYIKIRNLKIGEISDPFKTTDDNGNIVFRVVRLDDEIPAHRADLKDDYPYLYNGALMFHRQQLYQDWMKKKIETTYIKVSDEFKTCKFLEQGWLK